MHAHHPYVRILLGLSMFAWLAALGASVFGYLINRLSEAR